MSFAARSHAFESRYIREQEAIALAQRIGSSASVDGVPTSWASRPACEAVPVYVKGPQQFAPPPSAASEWGRSCAGASLGRSRWSSNDVSIYNVEAGRQMAQEAPRQLTHFEQIRQAKISAAARADAQEVVLNGLRLMPEYTPARALLWGSVLAVWISGAVFMTAAKSLNIHNVDEAEGKIGQVVRPARDFLRAAFLPIRAAVPDAPAADSMPTALSELAQRIRSKLN